MRKLYAPIGKQLPLILIISLPVLEGATLLPLQDDAGVLSRLKSTGHIGETIASTLERFCNQALQKETIPDNAVHAYWLELRATHQADNMTQSEEEDIRWAKVERVI